jgi:glutamate decarboxylase
MMCAGSTLANITALWIARNRALEPNNGGAGPEADGIVAALEHRGHRRAVIVGSRLMHYSIDKAAGLLGLGTRSVISFLSTPQPPRPGPATIPGRRDVERQRWWLSPTAGTTDCGVSILREMASICRECVHFHVDAAGHPPLFSARHRPAGGHEDADTVSLDGQAIAPAGRRRASIRDPHAAAVIEKEANYMLHEGSGDSEVARNRARRTPFCTRHCESVAPHEALIDHPSAWQAFADRVRT